MSQISVMSLVDLSWYWKITWNPKNVTILSKAIKDHGIDLWSLEFYCGDQTGDFFYIKSWSELLYYEKDSLWTRGSRTFFSQYREMHKMEMLYLQQT